jgi:type I restriction enzyme S subunit
VNFRYVDIAAISNASLSITDHKVYFGADAPSRARKLIRTGDVLVATTRPYLRSIAMVPSEYDQQICSTGLCVLRANGEVTPDWLFICVQSAEFTHQLVARMRGATYPAVTDGDVMRSLIPVPPVDAQRRLTPKVYESLRIANEIKVLNEEVLAEASGARASILSEVIAKSAQRFPVTSVGAVTLSSSYGTNQKCSASGTGVPVLRIPNVQAGRILFDDLKYASLSPRDIQKTSLVPGDLLIVRTNGSPDLVGRCAVFEATGTYSYASYLIRFRLDRTKCLPKYLTCFLSSTAGRDAIAKIRRTSAGQYNINSENIRSIEFPLPPTQAQVEIIEQMDGIAGSIERIACEGTERLKEAAFLRESILLKAFEGEL